MRYIQSVLRRRSARFWSGYLLYIIGSQTAAFLCELILLLAAPQLFDNPTALTRRFISFCAPFRTARRKNIALRRRNFSGCAP